MSNFNGWLIKFGEQVMPNGYLLLEGWDATPNQRTELDAYRDGNNLLHRETSENFKTKIIMSVRELELDEKILFQSIINSGMIDSVQRKVNLTYWNDETNQYVTSPTGFYIPDIQWKIKRIDEKSNQMFYKDFAITLIEY